MDWLRCNKCYRAMRDTTRNFSMTQCGHVYCGPCLEQCTATNDIIYLKKKKNCSPTYFPMALYSPQFSAGEKCHECGNVGFQVMALGKPPKLESIINYFSPLEDFMQVCYKAAQFQESQMAIAVMGFQYMVSIYDSRRCCETSSFIFGVYLCCKNCFKKNETSPAEYYFISELIRKSLRDPIHSHSTLMIFKLMQMSSES